MIMCSTRHRQNDTRVPAIRIVLSDTSYTRYPWDPNSKTNTRLVSITDNKTSGISIDPFQQTSHSQMDVLLTVLEKRKAEAARITQRFKDRVPVICEKVENSDIPEIDKRKYLVPVDLSIGQFVYVIRKRIKLPSEKAIFIFVNDILPPTAALISTIYEEHKDEDGFLYVLYSGENTFGQIGGDFTEEEIAEAKLNA